MTDQTPHKTFLQRWRLLIMFASTLILLPLTHSVIAVGVVSCAAFSVLNYPMAPCRSFDPLELRRGRALNLGCVA